MHLLDQQPVPSVRGGLAGEKWGDVEELQAPADAPPLVKLCMGKARRAVQATWSEIMANLHLDSELRAAAAASVLLGT